jgi:hypothetical protein
VILTGCATTNPPKVIQVSDFCGGRYEHLKLEERDFEVIGKIRQSDYFIPTMNKFIKYLTVNSKEYKECQK